MRFFPILLSLIVCLHSFTSHAEANDLLPNFTQIHEDWDQTNTLISKVLQKWNSTDPKINEHWSTTNTYMAQYSSPFFWVKTGIFIGLGFLTVYAPYQAIVFGIGKYCIAADTKRLSLDY